jgi:hypothetical protein
MALTTDPARMRVLRYQLRPSASRDELRLAMLLTAVAAGGLAGWRMALILHGAVLAAAAVAVLPGRHPS